MNSKTYLKQIAAAVCSLLLCTKLACAKGEMVQEPVNDSPYTTPFPLARGGEMVDVLVRVKNNKQAYYFNLVFVERQDWSQDKKDQLMRIFFGTAQIWEKKQPYPIKLHFQLDSVDGKNQVHIDEVVEERKPGYLDYSPYKGVSWRANAIHVTSLQPGIYRVRIKNLAPCPEIDFETLFQFKPDGHKP